jgi:hypothetical protein
MTTFHDWTQKERRRHETPSGRLISALMWGAISTFMLSELFFELSPSENNMAWIAVGFALMHLGRSIGLAIENLPDEPRTPTCQ